MIDFDKLYQNLERLGYEPHVFETGADAVKFLQRHLADRSVGFGGSVTVQQLGLYDALLKTAGALYWHWQTPGDETLRRAMTADAYILSANALTQSGQIVNLDGNGNRVAASVFGPGEVIYVIGQNKIVPDLQRAYERIKTVAAPKNAARLGKDTPCAKLGKCVDCRRPDSFCCALSILLRKPASVRSSVVLIREDLGY